MQWLHYCDLNPALGICVSLRRNRLAAADESSSTTIPLPAIGHGPFGGTSMLLESVLVQGHVAAVQSVQSVGVLEVENGRK